MLESLRAKLKINTDYWNVAVHLTQRNVFSLLQMLGQNSWWGARLLISLVEFQQRNILRLIAFSEIFLMPIAIVSVFMWVSSRKQSSKIFHEKISIHFAGAKLDSWHRSYIITSWPFVTHRAATLTPATCSMSCDLLWKRSLTTRKHQQSSERFCTPVSV